MNVFSGSSRVVIVGSGPAGVRCAQVLVAAGVTPTLIEENRRDGGQIYRRQPESFTRPYESLYGTEAGRAEHLHRSFEALRDRIEYLPETLVWNITEKQVHAVKGSKSVSVPFDAIILCTGATDRLMPVRGWHLGGSYSLGGAQIALKAQACSIGKQVVFAGTGPLLYLVAAQYVKAGATVAAVLDTSRWNSRMAAAGELLSAPSVLWKGIALMLALRRAGVPIYTGADVLEINGSAEDGVDGVTFAHRGRQHHIQCDAIAMGYHLRPETQLADLARCELRFDSLTRQWLPWTDPDGRSSVPGVYIAGDGARVLGAVAAELSGRLAAWAVLRDLGITPPADRHAEARRAHKKLDRFAKGLAEAFPWPAHQAARLSDDTILCRCESVRVGELREILRETGASEVNRAKAFSRVGMGRCQGRYCGHAAAEVIAHASGIPLEQVGRLRSQAPVKPIPIGIQP